MDLVDSVFSLNFIRNWWITAKKGYNQMNDVS